MSKLKLLVFPKKKEVENLSKGPYLGFARFH